MEAIGPERARVYIGLDLGRRRDPTAVVVLERLTVKTGEFDAVNWRSKWKVEFVLRHAERLALGTPYLGVVERVTRLARDYQAPGVGEPLRTIVVDASGVGAPVVELLKREPCGARIVPITITASGQAHSDTISGGYLVPRRDLITALRLLVESGKLRLAGSMHERENLTKELVAMRDRSGARRDDLAVAMGLAAWWARRA